jgi:hypothetical protein
MFFSQFRQRCALPQRRSKEVHCNQKSKRSFLEIFCAQERKSDIQKGYARHCLNKHKVIGDTEKKIKTAAGIEPWIFL